MASDAPHACRARSVVVTAILAVCGALAAPSDGHAQTSGRPAGTTPRGGDVFAASPPRGDAFAGTDTGPCNDPRITELAQQRRERAYRDTTGRVKTAADMLATRHGLRHPFVNRGGVCRDAPGVVFFIPLELDAEFRRNLALLAGGAGDEIFAGNGRPSGNGPDPAGGTGGGGDPGGRGTPPGRPGTPSPDATGPGTGPPGEAARLGHEARVRRCMKVLEQQGSLRGFPSCEGVLSAAQKGFEPAPVSKGAKRAPPAPPPPPCPGALVVLETSDPRNAIAAQWFLRGGKKTGGGLLSVMQARPADPALRGTRLVEHLTPGPSSCPQRIAAQACTSGTRAASAGSGREVANTFVLGSLSGLSMSIDVAGSIPGETVTLSVPYTAGPAVTARRGELHSMFLDAHLMLDFGAASVDVLADGPESCTVTCSQTFTCRAADGERRYGPFTITYTLEHEAPWAPFMGTGRTRVSATKTGPAAP